MPKKVGGVLLMLQNLCSVTSSANQESKEFINQPLVGLFAPLFAIAYIINDII
jgi:hypothetical protein